MGLTLLTPATVFPVTLVEARAQCRVTSTDEDTLIEGYVRAATRHVENALSLSIAEQTWKLTLDEFSDAIELLRGPVVSVQSVQYVDEDGVTQTLDADLYTVDLTSDQQWLVRNSDATYPSLLDGVNAVAITYTAGMGTVPDDLKHAILMLIAHWHSSRAATETGNVIPREVPFATAALIQPYRRVLV